jgi:hypothetical protein
VRVVRAGGFTIGVLCHGSGATLGGFIHNHIDLRTLDSNKYAVRFKGTSNGFVNENHFYGGTFSNRNAVVASAEEAFAYYVPAISASDANGNKFWGPSIELDWTRPADAEDFTGVGFYMEDSAGNVAFGCRMENTAVAARFTDNARYNHIHIAQYSNTDAAKADFRDTVEDDSDTLSNLVTAISAGAEPGVMEDRSRGVWHSGSLAHKATAYTSTTVICKGASFVTTSADTEPQFDSTAGTVLIRPEYLYFPGVGTTGLCLRLDTSRKKRFIIRRDYEDGFPGRIKIQPRDIDGTVLTSGDPDHPYVRGGAAVDNVFVFVSTTFSFYGEGSDFGRDRFFAVPDDVDHVLILLTGGTAPLKLKSVSIESIDGGAPAVSSGVSEWGESRIATAEPAFNGWYRAGEFVWNENAAMSQAIGWKCETSGWATDDAWQDTTVYAVEDIVENDTGKVYVCVTAGTSAGSGGPTGTGSGITDGTVVWDYVAPQATFRAGPTMP